MAFYVTVNSSRHKCERTRRSMTEEAIVNIHGDWTLVYG